MSWLNASPSKREWVWVAVCTVIGAVVRLWGFARLGLQHFDEGIYALAGLWVVLDGGLGAVGELLIPYAGPGFPGLVGLAYAAFGVSDRAAILVSELAGIAAIPTAAWVARRTFGVGAGAAAAGLLALSSMLVMFNRMALTDSTFLLLWLIALGLGGRCLEKPDWGRAVAFGATVGLAQNVKYVGWLIGFILGATAILGLLLKRRKDARAGRTIATLVVGGLVGACVYLPWYQYVDHHGGYSQLLAHQRSYLGGWASWKDHWLAQLSQVTALSGGPAWGLPAVGVAVAGAAWAAGAPRCSPWWVVLVGLGVGAALALCPTLPWWLGLAVLPWKLEADRAAERFLRVAWFFLSVLTPLYHPYARLWLPLVGVGWILLAGALVNLVRLGHDVSKGAVALRALSQPSRWSFRGVWSVSCCWSTRPRC